MIATAGFAAPVESEPEAPVRTVVARHLAGSVYMLTGAGGTVAASTGSDGTLVVDSGPVPLTDGRYVALLEQLRTAIEEIGSGPPRFVVNTHAHSDHVGGNAMFGTEARIVAHTKVRDRLTGKLRPAKRRIEAVVGPPHRRSYSEDLYVTTFGSSEFFWERWDRRRPVRRVRSAYSKEAMPVVTYEDGVSIQFNGEEVVIGHLPAGHTDGDSFVHFTGSNVVHVGDQFRPGRFPYVDMSYGGNAVGLRDSIGWLVDYLPVDAKVIPSHGPVSSVDDLRTYHRMLTECVAVVKAAKDAGKRLKKIRAAGLPGKWSDWGQDGITEPVFIGFIYDSL